MKNAAQWLYTKVGAHALATVFGPQKKNRLKAIHQRWCTGFSRLAQPMKNADQGCTPTLVSRL
ncbi:hypothetical protein Rcae01_00532 [Novipirellula caenicola]|uniref:Uncharacterized protein n=1 Tax=Novipirellula caenicola TaxID=1536901 RepID=A0ABP9VJX0_9BACT